MDPGCLFRNLPYDLQYIIADYNPRSIFYLLSETDKFDWFKLTKRIFSLDYDKRASTNEQIMKAYLHNCRRRSNIICDHTHTIIRTRDRRLMISGYRLEDNRFKEIVLPLESDEIIMCFNYTIIKLKDCTLMRAFPYGYGMSFVPIEKLPRNITQVISGSYHTIIRFTDGTLMGWGLNTRGELGLGTLYSPITFEKIFLPTYVVDVTCGINSTFIKLADGTLMSCGNNAFGQLGLGLEDNEIRNIFSEIKNIPKTVAKVICWHHSVFIKFEDGTLMSCGDNHAGQLGLGNNTDKNIFHEIFIPKNIFEVITRGSHTIIRLNDGRLMSCGNNQYGQLGLADYKSRNLFCDIPGIGTNIVELACGSHYIVIRMTDGKLMGCGYNVNGELGLGDYANKNSYQEIRDIPKNIKKVECGPNHTFLELTDGTLMCSGYNIYGQLGLHHNKTRNTFTAVCL
ncbi:MAG: chromosome condensation regulator [Harvfovirus sp.]|uniref:Chromosome condensation regulator n=1 Tax=Harvfovirus sp. TaxID=2487768 RepID=A0A3G5A6W3_9VIRU|nr:MAG: chromosome condensation regulator [Harvfovirus sp.]